MEPVEPPFVHQEAEGAAVHAEHRAGFAVLQHGVERLQHEAVAAQRDQRLGLVGIGPAVAAAKHGFGRLGRLAGGGDQPDADARQGRARAGRARGGRRSRAAKIRICAESATVPKRSAPEWRLGRRHCGEAKSTAMRGGSMARVRGQAGVGSEDSGARFADRATERSSRPSAATVSSFASSRRSSPPAAESPGSRRWPAGAAPKAPKNYSPGPRPRAWPSGCRGRSSARRCASPARWTGPLAESAPVDQPPAARPRPARL